jgi:hypothetical protein
VMVYARLLLDCLHGCNESTTQPGALRTCTRRT